MIHQIQSMWRALHENSFGIGVPDTGLYTIVFSCHGWASIVALVVELVEVKTKWLHGSLAKPDSE